MHATIMSKGGASYFHAALSEPREMVGFEPAERDTTQRSVFCHQNECDFLITDAQVGDIVDITSVKRSDKGPRGRGITFVSRTDVERVTGTITTLAPHRGFCFAHAPDVPGRGVFCHVSQFEDFDGSTSQTLDTLTPGVRVSFGLLHGDPRGPRAVKVRREP